MRIGVIVVGGVLAVLLAGCLDQDPGPVAPPVGPVPHDTVPVPPNPKDTLDTSIWLGDYPKGTPDSALTGDFAPVRIGDVWTYYEATSPSPADSMRIARVEVRILSEQPAAAGRIIRMGFLSAPRYVHHKLSAYGKTWEWDEVPTDTSAKRWEREFREVGDGFMERGTDGAWVPSLEAYGPGPHHRLRWLTSIDPSDPAYDTIPISVSPGLRNVQRIFARGVGLIRIDSSALSGPGGRTYAKLVALGDKIFEDSLRWELTRPLIPKDPRTGTMTIQEVADGLPANFCKLPGPPAVADPNLALAGYAEIKAGNTWEYLGTKILSSTAAWYASGSSIYKGLVRFSIGETRTVGACLVFSYSERDSLFNGISSSWNGTTTTTTSLPGDFTVRSGFGVRWGPNVYRWGLDGDSTHTKLTDLGIRKGELWPFGSGKSPVAVGDSATIGMYSYVLRNTATQAGKRLAYREDYSLHNPDPWETSTTLVKGLGVTSANYSTMPGQFMTRTQITLSLFRFDGGVVDTAIKASYDGLEATK